MPERDGKGQGEDSSKQVGSSWFAHHNSSLATSGTNFFPPALGVQMPYRLSLEFVCFVLFRFRLFAFTEAAALRSIVLQHACMPTATRSYLTTACVLFSFLFLAFFSFFEDIVTYPSIFVPLLFSLCVWFCVRPDEDICLDWLEVEQGLRQGFLLSPLLFHIFFTVVLTVVLQGISEDTVILVELVPLKEPPTSMGTDLAVDYARLTVWGILTVGRSRLNSLAIAAGVR